LGELEFFCQVAKPKNFTFFLGLDVELLPSGIKLGAFIVLAVHTVFLAILLPLDIASDYLLHFENACSL
jgi:hypothetical protein